MKFPGLDIREPLRRRPIAGALIGGLTGLLFGALNAAAGNGFPADARSVASGYVLGGLAAGAIVGALAPGFRRRWLAGLIVSVAMTIGLVIAVPLWGEDWGTALTAFIGLIGGLVYAGLFWDYRRDARDVQQKPAAE